MAVVLYKVGSAVNLNLSRPSLSALALIPSHESHPPSATLASSSPSFRVSFRGVADLDRSIPNGT
jgi:hypothetical protein